VRIKPRLDVASRFPDAASATDHFPFLRSLFLRTDRDEASQTSGRSKTLNSRNEHSPSRSKKSRPTLYPRSASFPSELSFAATATSSQPPDTHFSDQRPQSITSSSLRDADHRHSSTVSPTSSPRTRVLHAHTDPTPLRQSGTRPEFPHALVVSGLEHARILEQRALTRVLTEKRIVLEGGVPQGSSDPKSGKMQRARRGRASLDNKSNPFDDTKGLEDADYDGVWDVPDDFIMIYVCPWNTRERPNIHKTLVCLLRDPCDPVDRWLSSVS